MVVFMALIYYNIKKQNKSLGRRHLVFQRKSEPLSKGLSPWSHTRLPSFLQQRVVTTHVKHYPPGKLIRELGPEIFTGGSSWDSLCLAPAKMPGSQKESRCSAETILFYINSLGSGSLSYESGCWEPSTDPSSQTPAKGQPSQPSLSNPPTSGRALTPFCTDIPKLTLQVKALHSSNCGDLA